MCVLVVGSNNNNPNCLCSTLCTTDPDTRHCDEINNRAVHLTAYHHRPRTCLSSHTSVNHSQLSKTSANKPRQALRQYIPYLRQDNTIIFILQILSFLVVVVVCLLGPGPVNTFGIIGEALQAFQCGCGCRFYDVGTCETRTKKECKVGQVLVAKNILSFLFQTTYSKQCSTVYDNKCQNIPAQECKAGY